MHDRGLRWRIRMWIAWIIGWFCIVEGGRIGVIGRCDDRMWIQRLRRGLRNRADSDGGRHATLKAISIIAIVVLSLCTTGRSTLLVLRWG